MKKLIITIFTLGTLFVSAQESQRNVEKGIVKLNVLLSPSLEYEVSVSKNSTINLGLGTEVFYKGEALTKDMKLGLLPSANASYRYYYNFDKRAEKGKNVKRNSANYVALNTQYINGGKAIIGDVFYDKFYKGVVETMWGIQRNYDSGFSLGLEMGASYQFNYEVSELYPSVNFKLGWVLGKNK